MKKGKIFLTLLLAAALSFHTFPTYILAEDEYAEEQDLDGNETETEHPSSYYDEIQSNAIPGWPQGDPVNASAAIVMDAQMGAVLYAKDIDGRYYPASITKIMTALLALENGNLNDIVTFSEYAVYSIEYGSSHLGMTEGEKLTLEQCLYGILLASANEISNAVAEHIGGNIKNFVQMMNDKAAELGCTNTHFENAHGLHEENHYVSARDMALIMQAALKNEKFREIIGTVEYSYPKTNKVNEERYFMNHHKMIAEEGMLYDGCIGGKNGYTDEAYNTLVTAAERDGQELIAVVLKAPGQYVSYEDTKVLLDYGFANFKDVQITNTVSPDTEIIGLNEADTERVRRADLSKAPFSMVGAARVTLPENVGEEQLTKRMDFDSRVLTYSYEGQVMGSVPFTYTGIWETPAETSEETSPEASAQTETELVPAQTEERTEAQAGGIIRTLQGIFRKAADGAAYLYGRMDAFIEENTVLAAIIGAILLLVFVPLLLVAVTRQRKYQKIQALREEEMQLRSELEAEIEKKSAAQVEAELRASELQPDEPRAREDFYPEEKAEPEEEDEYIEIPLEDGEEPLD